MGSTGLWSLRGGRLGCLNTQPALLARGVQRAAAQEDRNRTEHSKPYRKEENSSEFRAAKVVEFARQTTREERSVQRISSRNLNKQLLIERKRKQSKMARIKE